MNDERDSIAPKEPWFHGSEKENRVLDAKVESVLEQVGVAEKEEIIFTIEDGCGGDDSWDVCDNPAYLDKGDSGYFGGCAEGGCESGSCSCSCTGGCASCVDDGGSGGS
jgi:hypothetical protein